MKLTNTNPEAGNAIILVMSILAVLIVIIAVSAEYTTTINRHVQRTNNMQAAVAIADGAIESQFTYWREICRINTTQPMPTSYMQYIPLPTGGSANTQFPNVPKFNAKAGTQANLVDEYDANYTVSNLKVVAVDPQLQPLPSASASPNPGIGMSGNDATFNYVASADVTLPALSGKVVARVRRIFQKQQYSPWTYAIFYIDPLEIHPGPAFTVTGPVHTNADLFTAHSSLTFADKVTYGRDWTVGFMPGDTTHPETPAKPNWASGLPPALDIAHQPFGLDANRIFTNPSNPNETDQYHELVEPVSLLIDPSTGKPYADQLVGKRYADQAGAIVSIDASNNVSFWRRNTDPTKPDVPLIRVDPALYNMLSAPGVITAKVGSPAADVMLQDNREAAQVRLATLDVSKLINPTVSGSGKSATIAWKAPFNGILYLRDSSGTNTTHRGFRLKNGQFIAAGGLTVASANPVYIQGDFNTGSNPPSNYGTPTSPEGDISGIGGKNGYLYSRQPCSVIADAVNILSNNWNDTNLLNGLGSRNATPTTVNTAIVSGIVPTGSGPGVYSGGAENFPRFLENWSGVGFTYYGSMVELYKSMQSVGTWGKGNVYNPPNRQWYFDNNFKLAAPPGSLMVYSYIKGQWSMQ